MAVRVALTTHEETFIEVRGSRVQVLRGGEGKPLLYLHGADLAGRWLPIHDLLSQRFEVFVPSHLGFGKSDRPEWLETVEDLAFHYLDFLELMGWEKVRVVGASLGGWIAAEMAVLHSERIEKLVLIGAAGLWIPETPVTDIFRLAPEGQLALQFSGLELARAYAPPSAPSPEFLDELYKNQFTFARLAWDPLLCNLKLRRRLYRVRCPALVIWGVEDRLVPPAHGHVYAQEIPNARLVLLKGCGHAADLELPDEVAREVKAFLTNGERGGFISEGGRPQGGLSSDRRPF